MKKLTLALFAVPALIFAPACSQEEVAAKTNDMKEMAGDAMADAKEMAGDAMAKAGEMIESIDWSALSPESIKEKVGEFGGTITESFGSIKDAATAENVKEKLQPIVDGLAKAKTMLGDKMPSMDSVKTAVEDLKTKFSGDNSIMEVLQPLIDKLQTLFN